MRLRTSSIVLLGITAAVTLSGCSGFSELTGGIFSGGSGPVFEFQAPQFDPEGGTLTIQVPQALLDARGEEKDPVLVTSMKISSRELEGAEYCAFEVEPTYASGAIEFMGAVSELEVDERSPVERIAAQLVTNIVRGEIEMFDESEPQVGAYIAEDASKLLVVSECSASLWEESKNYVRFPEPYGDYSTNFVAAEISVMKSGSIAVADSEVHGFAIDSEGNWISDS